MLIALIAFLGCCANDSLLSSHSILTNVHVICLCYLQLPSAKIDTQRVQISLQDIDTGLVYTTNLSPNDAHRVETDIVYASKVLYSLKKNRGDLDPSGSMISTASSPDATASVAEQDSAFKWSHQAILLLIEEYRKREEDITSGKISRKRVWESISGVLCNHGHDVTGPQCQSKFNGMKKTFKSIKDHNSKSGNTPRSWSYTEVMESLLGEKCFMNPIALASSSGQIRSQSECSDVSSDSNCGTSIGFSFLNTRRRKTSNIAEAILQSRKIAEENKLKRHEQWTSEPNFLIL